jgi:hypothetical protein
MEGDVGTNFYQTGQNTEILPNASDLQNNVGGFDEE